MQIYVFILTSPVPFGHCKDLKRSLAWALRHKRGLFTANCHLLQSSPPQPVSASSSPQHAPDISPAISTKAGQRVSRASTLWGWKGGTSHQGNLPRSPRALPCALAAHQAVAYDSRHKSATELEESRGCSFQLVGRAGEAKPPEGSW